MRLTLHAGLLALDLRIGEPGWEPAHGDLGLAADEIAEDEAEHAAFGFRVGE